VAGFRSPAGALFLESFPFGLAARVTLRSCGSCQCRLTILGAGVAGGIGGETGATAVAAGFTSVAGAMYAICNRSPFVRVSAAEAIPTEEGSMSPEAKATAFDSSAGCCGLTANLNEASTAMPSNRKTPSQTVRIICAPHSRRLVAIVHRH